MSGNQWRGINLGELLCVCIITDASDRFLMQFLEKYFTLRELSVHLQQCDVLERDVTDRAENSKLFGVNGRSILLELQHFDLYSGVLLPDAMHEKGFYIMNLNWFFNTAFWKNVIYHTECFHNAWKELNLGTWKWTIALLI